MEFLILATAHFMALISPGPDFFIIISTALKKPLKNAFMISIGIASANALYLCIAVLGLESIKQMAVLMKTLKYLGGLYLLYMGYMLIKAPKIDIIKETDASLHIEPLNKEFIKGFLSAFLNPKNIIFYLSLFTTIVSISTPLYTRTLYALWMCTLVLFWDIGISVLIGNKNIKKRLSTYIFTIEKFAGVALAIFGIGLVID